MDSEGKPTDTAGTSTQPPGRRTDELLSMLAERIGAKLSSATVFGSPVERDGVTVVPVAAARFGFGAGGGSDPAKHQEGEGGGGGGGVVPVATSSSRTAEAGSSRSSTRRGCSHSLPARSSPHSRSCVPRSLRIGAGALCAGDDASFRRVGA